MNPTQIAQNVRARRRELKLSQAELAARVTDLGVSWHQTTVAKVESMKKPRDVTLSEYIALAEALECPGFEDLLTPGRIETTGRHRVPDPRDKPWLSVAELAEITGEGEKAIRAAVAAGHLPSLNIGRYVRIPTAAFRTLCGLPATRESG